jgi:dihydrofolate reductase
MQIAAYSLRGWYFMRKLIEAAFVSLDGVVESAEQWALPYFSNEENKQYSLSRLMECDAFLFGRLTFELIESIASMVKGDAYYDRVGSMHKFVASTTLRELSGNASLLKGDTAEEIFNLKQQPGESIMKYGNGELDKSLIAHGLIDEFNFSIMPVVVGKGRRLFEGIDTAHLKLRLTGTTRFSNGVVTLSYVPL